MAETNIRTLLTAGLLFFIFFTGIVTLLYSIQNGDPLSASNDEAVGDFVETTQLQRYNSSFQKMNTTMANINDVSTRLQSASVSSTGVATLPLAFVSSAWDSVKILFGSFDFITEMISTTLGIFGNGVLGFVASFTTAILGLVIIFGIINIIFGRSE